MISRTTFIKLLNGIQQQFETDHCIGKAIDQLGTTDEDGMNNPFVFATPLATTLIHALEYELGDKYGSISYYIYDTEFGKKADELFLTLADGTEVKFYAAGHVYDYLTKHFHEAGDA